MQSTLIRSFPSVFTEQEADAILKTESLSEPEPTIGGYEEYTIELNQDFRKRIDACVNSYLKSLEINFSYTYKCSRLANITDIITRHSDSVVRLEPKHHIRDFIVISYMTNFKAGEIVFPQHGVILKPELGDTLIFPAGPFFQHLVNSAIGNRVILRSEYFQNLDFLGDKVDRKLWR